MREYVAKHRFARTTTRKTRPVMNMVRGLPVNDALDILAHSTRRAAYLLRKVLASAVANASQDQEINVNRLRVTRVFADDGPLLQGRMRWRAGPQGRAMPFRRRLCHITVVVGDETMEARGAEQSTGAEPKPAASE
jgi:large subunit ribosomal protein L22